jgi:hypothetical protein
MNRGQQLETVGASSIDSGDYPFLPKITHFLGNAVNPAFLKRKRRFYFPNFPFRFLGASSAYQNLATLNQTCLPPARPDPSIHEKSQEPRINPSAQDFINVHHLYLWQTSCSSEQIDPSALAV